jgi:hypothetical protein
MSSMNGPSPRVDAQNYTEGRPQGQEQPGTAYRFGERPVLYTSGKFRYRSRGKRNAFAEHQGCCDEGFLRSGCSRLAGRALILLAANVDSWPNGIKLASELLLESLLTQCLPGFKHQREALGPPLLDAWLNAIGAFKVNNQCC